MYYLKIFNKISTKGLERFDQSQFTISDEHDPQAILLRSQDLQSYSISNSLLAVGRAGVGVNNINVESCTRKGVVVFNTPGANANAVKELVLSSMLMNSRNIIQGIEYSKSLLGKGNKIPDLVEKNKSNFKGYELKGKKLGVIGLGAIGVLVANDAVNLGLKVQGHDPFISVQRAWGLSRNIIPAHNLRVMLSQCDFITLHMPLTPKTKAFINKEYLRYMKKGSVLLNFSRSEIINTNDVIDALDEGHLSCYINDFPTQQLLEHPKVLCIPHLGASTAEAETNCAIMVSDQIQDYVLTGNIVNSVNFPTTLLERTSDYRLLIMNDNIPKMVNKITTVLADVSLNITEMVNKSRDDLAYTILDINGPISEEALNEIKSIEGILRVRYIKFSESRKT